MNRNRSSWRHGMLLGMLKQIERRIFSGKFHGRNLRGVTRTFSISWKSGGRALLWCKSNAVYIDFSSAAARTNRLGIHLCRSCQTRQVDLSNCGSPFVTFAAIYTVKSGPRTRHFFFVFPLKCDSTQFQIVEKNMERKCNARQKRKKKNFKCLESQMCSLNEAVS